jgi:uncharacterized protein
MTSTVCPFPVVLLCEVGSGAHGIAHGGRDDRDEMGICIDSFASACGLDRPFEHFIYRSAEEREGRPGARSAPGDLDLTVYSLRKYCRLALGGNPTVMLLLYAAPLVVTPVGEALRALGPAFASRRAGRRFLGYLRAQRERLIGLRGQKNVNRPELVDRYGFDTKYAGHMLRLGYQGVEFMQTGSLALPMSEPYRSRVFAVRSGEVPLQDVLDEVVALEQQLLELLESSYLPAEPAIQTV